MTCGQRFPFAHYIHPLCVLHFLSVSFKFWVAPIRSLLVLACMSIKSYYSNVHIYVHRGRSSHSCVGMNRARSRTLNADHQLPKDGEDLQNIVHGLAAWKRWATFLSSIYYDASDSSSVCVSNSSHEGVGNADPVHPSALRLAGAEGRQYDSGVVPPWLRWSFGHVHLVLYL